MINMVTVIDWNVFSRQNAMVAPSAALAIKAHPVTQVQASTCSNETPPSNITLKTIGSEARNAFMVANNPAPILPKTTSVFDKEVIKSRISVCLSFSWLTALMPARAAMKRSTIS